MIVIQHMPVCQAWLVGLPCGCSRTELPDPPTNRAPRERWRLTGEVYDMGGGERVYVYQKDGPGFILTTGLSTVHFSRPTSPEVRKIATTIPVSEEMLTWNTNPVVFSMSEDMARAMLMLPPLSDTERALRNLERPIDYTTDWQITRARVAAWWGRLRWKLGGWIMDEPYGEDDYEW